MFMYTPPIKTKTMPTIHHERYTPSFPLPAGEFETHATPRRDTARLAAIGGIPISAEVATFAEKLHHQPLVLMEIAPGQKVSLTKLENFKPEVEPGGPIHEVPENIRRFTDDTNVSLTMDVTKSHALWQHRTFEVAERYAQESPDGQKLMTDLGIDSLRHLTPEQAVKFSTEFVRSVSKYTVEDTKKKGPTKADATASFDLLAEGLGFRSNSSWSGNGVCRNIAANVKVVFESLKASQGVDTLLANTYCKYDLGADGDGYDDKRPDPHLTETKEVRALRGAHAWNVFTTVGEGGSAVITIVDSTWALGGNSEVTAANADRTLERAGKFVNQLFDMSINKEDCFSDLAKYYGDLAMFGPKGKTTAQRKQIQEYALTQYLRAARQFPEGVDGVNTPTILLDTAYRSSNKLDPTEVAALYYHDKANGSIEANRIGNIFKNAYDRPLVIGGPNYVDKFLFPDSELQQFVFSGLGEQNLQKMASLNTDFRIRLRELQPESLPPFDASKPGDLRELKILAQLVDRYLTDTDPSKIVAQIKRRISQAAGNEQIVTAVLVGRSDYDIVKYAPAIIKQLDAR